MPLGKNLGEAARYTHLGVTFAAAVLFGFFGGYWLDGELGTKPLLTLAGAFFGAAAGFINLIKSLNQLQRNSEEKDKDKSK